MTKGPLPARPRTPTVADVPTQDKAFATPASAQPFLVVHHRAIVLASRTMLVMLVVAALAILALGVVALVRDGGAETDGWLRTLFGQVFGVVAMAMSAVLGIPAGLGLWAMAGATADEVAPVLSDTVRRALAAVAIVLVAATAFVALTNGRGPLVLDLGLIALVALATLGLAGAVAFSPHRWRATLSAVALLTVTAGTGWVLIRVMQAT